MLEMETLPVANKTFWFSFNIIQLVHLTTRLCRSRAAMDFSFAGIKLQSIQCIVQKLHEVKKSSLHSLGMGAHFVL